MNNNTLSIIDKWRNLSSANYRPLQASLELTNRCNERCTHCYLPSYKDDQERILSKEKWFEILAELRQAGVLYLILMGGEAMLNPLFWPIAQEASRLGFSLAMITNGLLITEQSAKKLADTGFSDITISFYSLNPEIHDRMTKVYGSQRRTQKAIEICLKNNLRVGVNCLLTEANIDSYFELADWCIDRKIEIKFDPIITPKFGGDLEPTKFRAKPDQLRRFYRRLVDKWPDGCPQPAMDSSDGHVCNAGKGKCAVTAYGELLTCIDIREPIGDLTKNKFADIWNNYVGRKWREFKNRDIKGLDKLTGSFCDHCPGMAFNEVGDPMQATDYSKMLAQIKYETYQYANKRKIGDGNEKNSENKSHEEQKEVSAT